MTNENARPASPSYAKECLDRSVHAWRGYTTLSGVIAGAFAAIAYSLGVVSHPAIPVLLFGFSILFFGLMYCFITPAAMWEDAQSQISEFQARLRPKLSITFDPEEPPYHQKMSLVHNRVPLGFDRIYRVGIRNESDAVIQPVRVVLERAYPLSGETPIFLGPEQPVLVEHPLNIMGLDEKHGLAVVAPGDRPTAFADVVMQRGISDDNAQEYFEIAYASGHSIELTANRRWMITLRAEGGGTFARKTYLVEPSSERSGIKMRESDS